MKQIIIFDLDGTLAPSKAPFEPEMIEPFTLLLQKTKVAVISGAAFHQFEKQVISSLQKDADFLKNLFVFPTNGTAMWVYEAGKWTQKYEEKLSPEDIAKIIEAIESSVKELGITVPKIYGKQIENRQSQVTFSALGQEAPIEVKSVWDPDFSIRKPLGRKIEEKIPNFEVRAGGMSSIDITRKGLTKAYAIEKITENLGIEKKDMLFIGDAIFPGGNDYAVKEAGVESIKVADPHETVKVIHNLLTI